MAVNSKQKGARFERKVAEILREHGYEARRGVQYNGANGDPDVIGLPGFHLECKHVERLNIEEAMQQSRVDARSGEIPVVVHKRNGKRVLITMEFDDFLELLKEK